MKQNYFIYIIHSGRARWLKLLREAIFERQSVLEIPDSSILLKDSPEEIEVDTDIGAKICIVLLEDREKVESGQVAFLRKCIEKNIVIIPVFDFDKKEGDQFENQIPENILSINAFPWTNDDSSRELASEIFESLSLTERERKVFISYKRSDGAGYANQLFDGLNRAGFRVFKDDFSVPLGVNFQKSLMEQLDEIAYLLLIETEESGESKWIQTEINYALEKHLGVAVIRFVDSEGKPLSSTASAASGQTFLHVTTNDIQQIKEGADANYSAFRKNRLDSILQFVRNSHAERLVARNHYLLDSIVDKCKDVGKKYSLERNWRLILNSFELEKPVYIGICYRTPRPVDMYRLEKSMEEHRIEYGILVHDASNMPEESKMLNYWSMRGNKVELMTLEEILFQIGEVS